VCRCSCGKTTLYGNQRCFECIRAEADHYYRESGSPESCRRCGRALSVELAMPELLSELLHELNCQHNPDNRLAGLGPTETNEHLVRAPGLVVVGSYRPAKD
jgi:hypothetical protein